MMNKNYDYFSLIEKKNNFIKKKIKYNFNNTINVKILGGYTNNEIEDWLGYFLSIKGIHAKIYSLGSSLPDQICEKNKDIS